MAVNIGDKPQADFTQPIELLMDCHRRIERFLAVLQKVAQAGRLDESHRAALQTSLDYFALAGPRHNEDEDASLFPALRASGNIAATSAVEHLQRLANEHAATE